MHSTSEKADKIFTLKRPHFCNELMLFMIFKSLTLLVQSYTAAGKNMSLRKSGFKYVYLLNRSFLYQTVIRNNSSHCQNFRSLFMAHYRRMAHLLFVFYLIRPWLFGVQPS